MGSRSIWKGSISFGLVNIPISLFSTTEDNDFSFNQLDDKGHRIQYKRWCPVEDKEVKYSEIKKGYEISKDNYVLIEKEDLEKIKVKTTKAIEIKEFIDSEEFDPIFVEKSYYIAPDDGNVNKKARKNNVTTASVKAYHLFVNAVRETNKIAIGKVVLKDKEHLVALRPYQRGMVMHQLRYLEEIKPVDEVESMPGSSSIETPPLDKKEISLGKMLVENLSSKEFDPSQYHDTYADQLQKLIDAKSKGKIYQTDIEETENDVGDNLMDALKASIQKINRGDHKKKSITVQQKNKIN